MTTKQIAPKRGNILCQANAVQTGHGSSPEGALQLSGSADAMKDRKTTRVQIELPQKAMARLKRLKEATEAGSYAEVIRNALVYYETMLKEPTP